MLALDKAAGLQNTCLAVLAAMGSLALVACSTATPVAKKAPVAKSADVAGPLVSETGFTLTENVQIAADTRAQYDNAVRLLEQKQYEQGHRVAAESHTERADGDRAVHRSRHCVRPHR